MLIEDACGAPARARVGRCQSSGQQLAAFGSGILPARQHHADRIGRADLHHLGWIAETLIRTGIEPGIGHVSECAGRGFARQRLIALHQHLANLAQTGLGSQVPELIQLRRSSGRSFVREIGRRRGYAASQFFCFGVPG